MVSCSYRIARMFGSGKLWQIWRIVCESPNLNRPNFSLSLVSLWLKSIHSPNNFFCQLLLIQQFVKHSRCTVFSDTHTDEVDK